MKSWYKVALVLSLFALLWSSLAGCGGGSGPEDAVRGLYKAMEAQDAERVGGYLTADIRDSFVSDLELALPLFDSIKISNLKITVVSETEDEATVDAVYDVEMEMDGDKDSSHENDRLYLEKVGGKWLISQLP